MFVISCYFLSNNVKFLFNDIQFRIKASNMKLNVAHDNIVLRKCIHVMVLFEKWPPNSRQHNSLCMNSESSKKMGLCDIIPEVWFTMPAVYTSRCDNEANEQHIHQLWKVCIHIKVVDVQTLLITICLSRH